MSQVECSSASWVRGYHLEPRDASSCEAHIAWLLGDPGACMPDGAARLEWALAHCDDGVTWGRYDPGAKVWHLGSEAVPGVSPSIQRKTLQELRFFGQIGEVLMWRTADGFRGRYLRELDRHDTDGPLRRTEEQRILRGDRIVQTNENGFSRIADGTGAEQVVPVVVTEGELKEGRLRVMVHHYYEMEAATGVVRIAASRLVGLTNGGTHEA